MGYRSQFRTVWQRKPLLLPGFALVLVTTMTVAWQASSAFTSAVATPEALTQVELRTLDGQQLRLQDLQGQPVLLSFWSTSCGICLQEMPEMNQLDQALVAAGARLFSIAMPYDPPNHVLEISEALQISSPVAIDLDGSASTAFDVPGTPYKVLLSKNGQIAETFTGPLDYTKTLESVSKLLSQP